MSHAFAFPQVPSCERADAQEAADCSLELLAIRDGVAEQIPAGGIGYDAHKLCVAICLNPVQIHRAIA